MIQTNGNDLAVGDPESGFNNFLAEQDPATFDQHIVHDAAP